MNAALHEPPAILGLVADPIRWQLLRVLASSDRRVGELTEEVGKPQNLVSYHLGELRKAGVVTARRSSADGRDVYYRADLTLCRELLGSAGVGIHPALRLAPGPSPATERKARAPEVLFLCTGNSARSQMAAALLEHRSGQTIKARSAGSHPKALHPYAVEAMAKRGVDISTNEPAHFDRFLRKRFDRVVTLCDKVREVCPEFPGEPTSSHWSIADPAADGSRETFERTAEELEDRIAFLILDLNDSPRRNRHGDQ